MEIAVGDTIKTICESKDFAVGSVGVVHKLGVVYLGDVRVKFPHDKELIWVYSDEYEKEEASN